MSISAYNERSWAIDVIGEIKKYFSERSLIIKNAGGEHTLRGSGNVYFPDVLLFADDQGKSILHGWELKMPDTPVSDPELISNARKKADILGVNSFLVWNVREAVLYRIDDEGRNEAIRTWDELTDITDRFLVRERRADWIKVLHRILDDLVDFFTRGEIRSTSIIHSLTGEGVTNYILDHADLVADTLRDHAQTDVGFEDAVAGWWDAVESEHPYARSEWKPLASQVLISWLNKLTFAHILKNVRQEAALIDTIQDGTTLDEARSILRQITEQCDFWNIFSPQLGEYAIPELVWTKLKSYHALLMDLKLGSIDPELVREILQSTIYRAQRKMAGQFATPPLLAQLLAELTVRNKREPAYDPCCGTGTIPKALYELKVRAGISPREALASVWASDKFSYPLQLATISLSRPDNFGEVLHIFQMDVGDAAPGVEVVLRDPTNGSEIRTGLPPMGSIVCNLPFIRQETSNRINGAAMRHAGRIIAEHTGDEALLKKKSDFYAYLPFLLWGLLQDSGRLGLIVSNAWLATDWGEPFRRALRYFYHIDYVLTSGKGKWFDNADVVTNLIVLQKKTAETGGSAAATSFVTLEEELGALADGESSIADLARRIRTNQLAAPNLMKSYTAKELDYVDALGLSWGVLFSECGWLRQVEESMIAASELLHIARGERRGANDMFYPRSGHGIEPDYIAPVLKTSKQIHDYESVSVSEAFCCTLPLERLEELGHRGALAWVRRFAGTTNGIGKPIEQALARANLHWYSMEPNTMADFVISINPDKRLFVAKPRQRLFVDQRLVRFTAIRPELDLELLHALMNSVMGLFYIEALGFGRGLGVLDLNAGKFKRSFKLLNPDLLTPDQAADIKKQFVVLKRRGLMDLEDDLASPERQAFDRTVFRAYGLESRLPEIVASLRTIFRIRKSVEDDSQQ